ncbi:serine hydrolase domain-containing protein [Streptomyces sp. DSM 44915]|uniref:Serine hydrolase domain-containing protein n=1 Tax=Streptomyces chisholmiae TaxID=3075540 RepID=A0ABU2JP10_9ACTN|nr:serine hydrolase domain-containing protein [Streptomyces sp. DSM 44915]MDT0266454.1 serine hydrolase domain-containing protein [Streptomyces sp. DSM 44915]
MTASSRRSKRALTTGAASAALCLSALTVPAAVAQSAPDTPVSTTNAALDAALAEIPASGLPGAYGAARVGEERWQGAAGVADLTDGSPAEADSYHRIASLTKTFVSVAVLQQVADGALELDALAADHLPAGTLPAELAEAVTVRMLLNHTTGIGDYIASAFPSLATLSPASLEEHRFRELAPAELVELGLAAPRTGEPGQRYSYSNTNYILAGLLVEQVTGQPAEEYVTERVIAPAGLTDTFFPDSPELPTPHARLYQPLHGTQDPPDDFTEYNMSWAGTAGALVSTMPDLNRFQEALFGGELLPAEQLAEMLETVPIRGQNGQVTGAYGLGLYPIALSCDTFWGHDGIAWGASTLAFSSLDGERQAAIGYNMSHYQTLSADGYLNPHPGDRAVVRYLDEALCGAESELTAETLRQAELALQTARLDRTPLS